MRVLAYDRFTPGVTMETITPYLTKGGQCLASGHWGASVSSKTSLSNNEGTSPADTSGSDSAVTKLV